MAKTWVSPHCSSTWNPSVTPPGTEKRQSPELGFEALLWGPRLSIISFTTSPPTAPLQLPLCHTLHLRFRTFCLYSHNLFTTYNLTQITAFPINLSYDPAVLLVDIHPKEMKVSSKQVQWDVQRSMFIPALFTTVKIWSQPKCPSVGEQINPPPPKNKMWYICKIEYYAAMSKEATLPIVTTQMECEQSMLSEISQSKRSIYSQGMGNGRLRLMVFKGTNL